MTDQISQVRADKTGHEVTDRTFNTWAGTLNAFMRNQSKTNSATTASMGVGQSAYITAAALVIPDFTTGSPVQYNCNPSGAMAITLPDGTKNKGVEYTIVNLSTNVITISAFTAQTVDGAASVQLKSQFGAAILKCGNAAAVSDPNWTCGNFMLPTGVTAGSYTFANITVGADGRLSAASSGTPPTSLQEMPLALPTSDTSPDNDEFLGTLVVDTGAKTLTFGSANAWTYSTLGSGSPALTDPTVVTALNPTTAVAAPVWNLDATSRTSRARFQLGYDGSHAQSIQLSKVLSQAFPTNGIVWIRCSGMNKWNGPISGNAVVQVSLVDAATPSPHFVYIQLVQNTNYGVQYFSDVLGGTVNIGSANIWDVPVSYIGFWRQGTSWTALAANENGGWSLGNTPFTNTFTPTSVNITIGCNSNASPGSAIVDVDLLRIGTRLP